MYFLQVGLGIVQHGSIFEAHVVLQGLQFLEQVACFDFGLLEPSGILARILAGAFERVPGQIDRFLDLARGGRHRRVVALLIGFTRGFQRGSRVFQRQFGALAEIVFGQRGLQVRVQRGAGTNKAQRKQHRDGSYAFHRLSISLCRMRTRCRA